MTPCFLRNYAETTQLLVLQKYNISLEHHRGGMVYNTT